MLVNISRVSCVEATNSCATKSSSWVAAPVMPRPPRRCALYRFLRVALDVAAVGDGDDHLLRRDHVLDVDVGDVVGDLGAPARRCSLLHLFQLRDHHRHAGPPRCPGSPPAGRSAAPSSSISAISASRSRPVSLARRMSRMAWACRADSSKVCHQARLGGLGVRRRADEVDDRVDVVDGDLRPSRMCIRSRATRSS